MKKLLLCFLLSPFTLSAENEFFDNMDKKTSVSTGIYKLSSKEKTALIKWLSETNEKTRQEIKDEVRTEVIADVKEEVRTEVIAIVKKEVRTEVIAEVKEEVKKEVIEEVREEVTKEVEKDDRKKFMGFRLRESDREEIKTTIKGEFRGWKGKHIFNLANGQIWKQNESGKFYIPKRQNTNITIKPKSLGTWVLYVEGFSRGVKVKRVK